MRNSKRGSDDPIAVRCTNHGRHGARIVRATWAFYLEISRPGSGTALVREGELCDSCVHEVPAKGEKFDERGHIVTKRELRRIR